jgi:hypothetical protein
MTRYLNPALGIEMRSEYSQIQHGAKSKQRQTRANGRFVKCLPAEAKVLIAKSRTIKN